METVSQWALRNGYPFRTVRYWCKSGHLKAKRVGSVWLIPPGTKVQSFDNKPARGRPRKKGAGK